jgi:site-specific DNA-methyltransferase (adenine-specific)
MEERAKRGEKWARRNGRSPYDVMSTADICQIPVQRWAAKDCVLLLWATFPKMKDALQVVEAWGFTYKTVAFSWAKLTPSGRGYHFGLGYWTHGNVEVCLLATRGKPKRQQKDVAQLIVAPRGEHSSKPRETYDRIERLLEGPYLELFARPPVREGWTQIGEELGTLLTPDGIVKIENEEEEPCQKSPRTWTQLNLPGTEILAG